MKKILSSFLFIIALCFSASAEEHANDTYAYDDSDTSGTYIDYDSVEVVYADGYYSNYNTVTFDNSMIYERIQREATGMLRIICIAAVIFIIFLVRAICTKDKDKRNELLRGMFLSVLLLALFLWFKSCQ